MKFTNQLRYVWAPLATLLATVLFLATDHAAIGQGLSQKVSESDQGALRALAKSIGEGRGKVDIVLNELGFSVGADVKSRWPDFEQWPAVRKIETAYVFA